MSGEPNNTSVGYVVSLCGVMSAAAIAIMFVFGFIPSFEFVAPAAAGLPVWIVRENLGVKHGLVCYAAVGLLCMLLTPNYESAALFVFLLGYYPIVREYFQKIRSRILRAAVKLSVFVASSAACCALLIFVFGLSELIESTDELGKYGLVIIGALAALAFAAYDIFLGFMRPFYVKLVKPKIKKRLK